MFFQKQLTLYFAISILLLLGCGEDSSNFSTPLSSSNVDPSTVQLYNLLPSNVTGVQFNNKIQEDLAVNYLRYDGIYMGAGVGTGDLNNDGLTDLYFPGNQVHDQIYINKGDMKFENITDKAGIIKDNSWSTGVSFVDINTDGYLDIYVCKFLFEDSSLRQNQLYINNGDETFTESAAKYGINDSGYSVQANFFDYDKDGDLDLYIANQPPNASHLKKQLTNKKEFKYTDRLYKNNGNGSVSYTHLTLPTTPYV